jgi:RNA polymerase sigma factor (sigma-70 family)
MTALVVGTALSTLGILAPETAAAPAVRDISRYCTTCWRNARLQPDHWQDCTQEVFVRLLERVNPERWDRVLTPEETDERREFLRAIDAVKKRTQRARRPASLEADAADRGEPRRQELAEQRHTVLQAAAEHLTPRQSRILKLSLDGWSVADISSELALPPERVSDEKYKAVQRLRGLEW